MAHQPSAAFFLISRNLVLLHESKDFPQDHTIRFCADTAVCARNDRMCSAGVKARNRISIFIYANRILRLVTIMIRIFHSDNRLHHAFDLFRRESADALQIAKYLLLLDLKLFVIGNCLQLTTTTWLIDRAARLYAKRRRYKYLLTSCVCIILFYFCQKCQNFIALHCILYKECESVDLSDALAGNTRVCDLNFDLTVFLIFHK